MASKKVEDFFKNKVTIRLKNGHQFKGLLSKVDNKNGVIILQDIEDLGNAYDKQQLPGDKKLIEKKFESQIIEQIILTDKVFADPKKYNRDDFFDSMTEHKQVKFVKDERGQREYKPRGGYRGRGGRGGGESDYRNKKQREYKPKKSYEGKQQRREEDEERQYR